MQTTTPVEIRHFHLFCGLGGGARGFNRASPRVGNLQAKFRCLGGIDVDPASIRDFGRLAGVPGAHVHGAGDALRLAAHVLHDVYLATFWPSAKAIFLGKHPYCWPSAAPLG